VCSLCLCVCISLPLNWSFSSLHSDIKIVFIPLRKTNIYSICLSAHSCMYLCICLAVDKCVNKSCSVSIYIFTYMPMTPIYLSFWGQSCRWRVKVKTPCEGWTLPLLLGLWMCVWGAQCLLKIYKWGVGRAGGEGGGQRVSGGVTHWALRSPSTE
jgi:hypothetical protein